MNQQPSQEQALKQSHKQYIANLKKEMRSLIRPKLLTKNIPEDHEKTNEKDYGSQLPKFDKLTPNQLAAFKDFYQDYQRRQIIGKGCNGTVYKCWHIKKQKMYALKIVGFKLEQIHYLKESFYYMSDLYHKNIIQYHALYVNAKKKQAYIVTELFEHPTLLKYATKLAEEQLKNIVQSIISALCYLHSQGICHRDIKPDNILYDIDKKLVKIIDFGISRKFRILNFTQQMMTATGTELYKAPQMITGGVYTELIDEWALGITIYNIITKQTPFWADHVSDINQRIKKGFINFDMEIWSKYSPFARDLVSRLLKPEKQRISAKQAKKHLWFQGVQKKTTSIYAPIKPLRMTWDDEQIVGKSCNDQDDQIYESPSKSQIKAFKKRCTQQRKVFNGDMVNSDEQFYEVVNSPSVPQ